MVLEDIDDDDVEGLLRVVGGLERAGVVVMLTSDGVSLPVLGPV